MIQSAKRALASPRNSQFAQHLICGRVFDPKVIAHIWDLWLLGVFLHPLLETDDFASHRLSVGNEPRI